MKKKMDIGKKCLNYTAKVLNTTSTETHLPSYTHSEPFSAGI